MHRFHVEGFSKRRQNWVLVGTEPDVYHAIENAKETARICDCETRVRTLAYTGAMVNVWPSEFYDSYVGQDDL